MEEIALIFLLATLPCFAFAQTTNAPTSVVDNDKANDINPVIDKRVASIKDLREILSNPKSTAEQTTKAANLALQLLDADSDLFVADKATILLMKQKIEKLGGNPAVQSLFPGSKISFTTLDGKSYKDAQITTISSDSFSIITSDGGATVQMDNIDKDLQDKFSYQPPPVIPQVSDPSQIQSTPQPPPTTDPSAASSDVPTTTISGKPLKDGLNIVGVDAKIMKSSESGEYLYIAWKVTLYDKGTDPLNDVSVTLSYRDKDNFEVERSLGHALKIEPSESFDVTGQELMKPDEWAKVTGYSVETN